MITNCGMDTVEGTLIVGTVVQWFSGLAKGGRQLEPYGSGGRKLNLSYEKKSRYNHSSAAL